MGVPSGAGVRAVGVWASSSPHCHPPRIPLEAAGSPAGQAGTRRAVPLPQPLPYLLEVRVGVAQPRTVLEPCLRLRDRLQDLDLLQSSPLQLRHQSIKIINSFKKKINLSPRSIAVCAGSMSGQIVLSRLW